MVEKEVILQQEALKDLSEAQVSAVENLYKNAVDTQIGSRVSEIYSAFDNDIKEASGVERQPNEKSYAYAKRVIGDLKSQAEEVDTYKSKYTELEAKLKDGSMDAELKSKLKDSDDLIKDLRSKLDQERQEAEKMINEVKSERKRDLINAEFALATKDLKFNPNTPQEAIDALVEKAQEKILAAYDTDFSADLGSKLVFRDKDTQAIMKNQSDGLNPFTAADFMKQELKSVLAVEKQATGTGTDKVRTPGGGGNFSSTAKSAVELNGEIRTYLLESGVSARSEDFYKQQKALFVAAGGDKLPMQ